MSKVAGTVTSVILIIVGALATLAASTRAVDHYALPAPPGSGISNEGTNVVAGGVFATVVAALATAGLLAWTIAYLVRREALQGVWWLLPAALTAIAVVAAVGALSMRHLVY